MVYYDYESELYPAFYHEPHDFDWGKAYLLSLPTDELKEKYREYTEMLEKWRNKEPSKKNADIKMNTGCGYSTLTTCGIY